MLKVQKVGFKNSSIPHWTVIGNDYLPIDPINHFLLFLRNTNKSIYTIKSYSYHLKTFWEFLLNYKYNWQKVTLDILARFIANLSGLMDGNIVHLNLSSSTRSERTINQIMNAVIGFYKYHFHLGNVKEISFYDWKRSYYNSKSFKPLLHHISKSKKKPHSVLKLKEIKPLPKIVTPDQVKQFISACSHKRDRLLICLLYETGCRISQAIGLRHEDIETFDNVISIKPRIDNLNNARAKTVYENKIHVSKDLMELYCNYYLDEYGDINSDYVFINLWNGNIGHPINYGTVSRLFYRLSIKTGIHLTPHMLRHTHATQLLNSGWSMAHVQKRLGHRNIETTINNYIHLSDKNMKDAHNKFLESQK